MLKIKNELKASLTASGAVGGACSVAGGIGHLHFGIILPIIGIVIALAALAILSVSISGCRHEKLPHHYRCTVGKCLLISAVLLLAFSIVLLLIPHIAHIAEIILLFFWAALLTFVIIEISLYLRCLINCTCRRDS